MTQLLSTLAQAAAPSGPSGILGSPFIMMGLLIAMFYFLLIRPQQRQKKEQAARMAAMEKGDKVITTAGIHGIIHNIKEQTVILKVADSTNLEFDKAAITTVAKKDVKKEVKEA